MSLVPPTKSMEKFKDVLEGKVKKEDLTPDELEGYRVYVADLAKEEETRVTGLRGARQAEEKKLADAKAEAERLAKGNQPPVDIPPQNPQDPRLGQFRDEQVLKAKKRLWEKLAVTDAEKAVIEDKFSKLDSGKMDADLIFEDLMSAVAAANPMKFMELSDDAARREREARQLLEQDAGGAGSGGGSGNEPKKFSDQAVKIAREAGITPEAAERQLKMGTKRVYD